MREFSIEDKYLVEGSAAVKGLQDKYKKDNYYYKPNKFSNEGFVEFLVSRVIKNSTIHPSLYLPYEYCTINGKQGSRSRNFLHANEVFIAMDSIYTRVTGKDEFGNMLFSIASVEERLKYILHLIEEFGFDPIEYRWYLKTMVELDMLISNKGRDSRKYGIIYNCANQTFRLPPLFDNGMSLGSDMSSDNSACTICQSHVDQALAFGCPIEPSFKIDYKKLEFELYNIEAAYGKSRELKVLRNSLDGYENLFGM